MTSGLQMKKEKNFMITCTEAHHAHLHGPNCGHTAIRHEGHVDYLHDGHLHHMHVDMLTSMSSPSAPRIPCAALPKSGV